MADKTPLRLVLDGNNNPTGLAEFQSGETIGNSFLTNSGITLADDSSSTTTISLGETLKIAGGSGVDTTISGDTLTISLESTVVTETSSDTLTNKSISGSTNTLSDIGNISLTNSSFTIVDDSSTTSTISLGEALKLSGDTGITTTISGDTVNIDLDDTAVTPNTYGSSTSIPVITIDQQGRITGASTQSISTTLTISDDTSTLASINLGTDTLKIAGDTGITTSILGDTINIDLDDTTVTPNTYGSSTAIPVLTIDQQGRITSASTQNISTTLSISDDSSTLATINLGSDTLKISGTSNEIETSISGDTITIGLPNDVIIAGNLTVNGTTTTVNTTNTTVTDKLLELGTGRTGSASGDAGIVIERGDDNNIFIGYDESADVVTFGSGTFTGASTGDLAFTESNIKAADITSTGNLDITGTTTLRGSITLGVNSGDSTEDSITVNARFISNLEPLHNITYDLGSPNRRWRDIYLSGNTIDLNGATISGDGSGAITISATGAVLPTGSQVGSQSIATADPDTGISTRFVPLYTQTSGLSTAATNLIFKSGNETGQLVFTDFTVSNGQNIVNYNAGGTLFAF
jgi:hypothetical protein